MLEVGCGTGDVLTHLRPHDGLGTDLSAAMLRLAAEKYPHLRFARHDLMGPGAARALPLRGGGGRGRARARPGPGDAVQAAILEPEGTAGGDHVPKGVPGLRRLNTCAWASGLRKRFGLVQRATFSLP